MNRKARIGLPLSIQAKDRASSLGTAQQLPSLSPRQHRSQRSPQGPARRRSSDGLVVGDLSSGGTSYGKIRSSGIRTAMSSSSSATGGSLQDRTPRSGSRLTSLRRPSLVSSSLCSGTGPPKRTSRLPPAPLELLPCFTARGTLCSELTTGSRTSVPGLMDAPASPLLRSQRMPASARQTGKFRTRCTFPRRRMVPR